DPPRHALRDARVPVARVPEPDVAAPRQLRQRRRDVRDAPAARVGVEPRRRAGAGDGHPGADVVGGVEIAADVDADAAGPAALDLRRQAAGEAFLPGGMQGAAVVGLGVAEVAAGGVALGAAGGGTPGAGGEGGQAEGVDAFAELAVAQGEQVAYSRP